MWLLYYVIKHKINNTSSYYSRYFSLLAVATVTGFLGCTDEILKIELFSTYLSLKYIVHICYIVGIMVITGLITMFHLSFIGIDNASERKWYILVYAPVVAYSLFDITTFMHRLLFYYHSNGKLSHGMLYPLIYIFMAYYMALWIYIAVRYRKLLTNNRVIYIISFTSICLLGSIFYIQTLFLGIYNFIFSLALIIIINTIQRPIDVFDASGALRRGLLFYDLNQDFNRKTYFSVLFIKLNEFKTLLEAYGELETNIFMKRISDYLSEIHDDASLYRMENNIFALQIPDDDEYRIKNIAKDIIDRFTDEFSTGNNRAKIQASVVILRCPLEINNINDFKILTNKIAETKIASETIVDALEAVKKDRETDVINAIRKALDRNTFRVFYQPIYSTEKKKIIAAEALIRLFDDKLGFVSPEEFIPIAEREGYIIKIGKFVFEEVCRFIKSNSLANKGIEYIEVNLSAVQCTNSNLAEEFIEIMNNNNIRANQINFEITESSILINNDTVIKNIDDFTNYGCELSLDDYGTGYSSITYLSSMPFSIIKVDKSILWAADSNEKANLTLENIFSMAQELKMRVVVEGVEKEEHIKKLIQLGCDYFQGYYFSKPVKGVDFIDYLDSFKLPEVCNQSNI